MEFIKIISKIFMLLFLFVVAVIDYRKKEISVILPIIGFVPSVIFSLIAKTPSILDMLLGCAIGGLLIVLAKLSKQAIGYGDGMILVCTGTSLGLIKNLILLAISLIIAACAGALLMFIKHKKKKDNVAFIPFIFAGYVATISFLI